MDQREDGTVAGVDVVAGAGAEFGALPEGVEGPAEPREERVRVALLFGDVDVLVCVLPGVDGREVHVVG